MTLGKAFASLVKLHFREDCPHPAALLYQAITPIGLYLLLLQTFEAAW